MSIVGEVGVIIGLITGTIEIVKSTKSLHSAYKDAKGLPKEFRSIAAKFPLVLEILRNAEKKGQATQLDDEQTNEAEKNIRACHEKVEALNKIFKAVLPDADANRLERYKKAVASLGKGKQVEELMGEIMKHIELVTCDKLMGTATGDEIKKLKEAIQEMLDMPSSIPEDSGSITQHSSGSGNNIASRVTYNNIGEGTYTNSNTGKGPQLNNNGAGTFNYNRYSDSQKSTTLLQSLCFPEMELHKKDISEAVEDTCEWLCDEPDYKSWLARSQSLLWIIGIPGSGKSTLMKYIFQQDTSQLSRTEPTEGTQHPYQQAPKKLIVASFFCYSTGVTIQKNRIGLFRSLLHQILQQIPELPPEVTSHFDKRCNLEVKPGENLVWHQRDLKQMLQISISYIAKEYPDEYVLRIYVDALDEFSSNEPNGNNEPRDLAEYFQILTSLDILGIDLHVCISCRDYPFIAKGGLKISIGNKNRQDILTYVQTKLASIKGQGNEARNLTNWIVENASGIFEWAVIVVEKAKDFEYIKSPERILDKLKDLPQGLDKLYDKSFKTMNRDCLLQSLRLLSWICFARRPLSVSELYDAMVFEPSITTLRKSVGYRSSHHDMAEVIQHHSCNLAVIIEHKGQHTVQLRHQSAYDYLVSSGLKYFDDNDPTSGSPAYSLVGWVHLRLLKSCIDYLSSEKILRRIDAEGSLEDGIATNYTAEDFEDDHPFCRYAALHWAYHAKLVEDENPNQGDLLRLYHQLANSPPEESNMAAAMFRYRERGITLLHIASQYGLLNLIELILKLQNNPTGGERQLTSDNIIAKVLQRRSKKIDVNIQTISGLTPLVLAIEGKHEAIVKLLLNNHNASVNTVGQESHSTALISAVKSRHEGIVAVLLQRDKIDVNATDMYGKTALICTIETGHKEILRMLLQHSKIDVDIVTTWGHTALRSAIMERDEGIMALLLQNSKIDVNTRDRSGTTPLITAIKFGKKGIAALLLGHGKIDVNARDGSGTTPLITSIKRGQKGIARRLLRHSKIDVNARDESGTTPLMVAVRKGEEKIVELLLQDRNIEVHSVDESPSDIIKKGHRGVLEVLQRNRVISAITTNGPRRIIVGKGAIGTGWLLLHMDLSGPTPLMAAVRMGKERVVELLLQHSKIDPNVGNGILGEVPLYEAVKTRRKAIATLLLQHIKIQVNEPGDRGETPLFVAARYGYEEMVILLLEKSKADIDISRRNMYNQSPLTIAIEEKEWTVVQLLLKERTRMSEADERVAQTLEDISLDEINEMSDNMKRRSAQARREEREHLWG